MGVLRKNIVFFWENKGILEAKKPTRNNKKMFGMRDYSYLYLDSDLST